MATVMRLNTVINTEITAVAESINEKKNSDLEPRVTILGFGKCTRIACRPFLLIFHLLHQAEEAR